MILTLPGRKYPLMMYPPPRRGLDTKKVAFGDREGACVQGLPIQSKVCRILQKRIKHNARKENARKMDAKHTGTDVGTTQNVNKNARKISRAKSQDAKRRARTCTMNTLAKNNHGEICAMKPAPNARK